MLIGLPYFLTESANCFLFVYQQMLLQGSNRIPADSNERFEDHFDEDAAILLKLIRKVTSEPEPGRNGTA